MNINILLKYLLKISLNHFMILVCSLIFNLSSDFFFQFEGCIIYCFHAEVVFDFVLDVLLVVYKPKVNLIEKS